ncbi:MAG TPA: hypothetical protein VGP12_03275 [Nitrosospira sp.]|jgi:hypothetical protein|nr:hypothetical protein [Nitrosospira sp.]
MDNKADVRILRHYLISADYVCDDAKGVPDRADADRVSPSPMPPNRAHQRVANPAKQQSLIHRIVQVA